jgi:hypothetical protein
VKETASMIEVSCRILSAQIEPLKARWTTSGIGRYLKSEVSLTKLSLC